MNSRKHECNQKTGRKFNRKLLKRVRNQLGEHLVNPCESNNFETKAIVSIQLQGINQNFFPF